MFVMFSYDIDKLPHSFVYIYTNKRENILDWSFENTEDREPLSGTSGRRDGILTDFIGNLPGNGKKTLRKCTISIKSRRSFFLETKPKRTEIKLWKNTNEGYYLSTGKMERRCSELNWRYTEAFNVASMGNK